MSEFSGELDKVKALAVGAGIALVRDLVTQSVPVTLRSKVSEMMDSVTTKLGGEVVQGPLWSSAQQQSGQGHGQN